MAAREQELGKMSALGLADLLRSRKVSAVEVLDDFLARYERLNPAINAIIALDYAEAKKQAEQSQERIMKGSPLSPLEGIPITVKDNIFVAGLRATWGSRLYQDFFPPYDDIAIERARKAGGNIVAKTNTPEFALGSQTTNEIFGPTRNPWNPQLTPGGSSGGAVAALAAGLAPMAIGTDAGGSIRRPASYTGCVGFRPTTGRIPRVYGFPPIAHDFQVIAPAARTVDDAYLLFRIMAGRDARDRLSLFFHDYPLPDRLDAQPAQRLRIRCVLGIGDVPVDAEVRRHVAAAAEQLQSLGHIVEDGVAPFDLDQVESAWSAIASAGLARAVRLQEDWLERVQPTSRDLAEKGLALPAQEYLNGLHLTAQLRNQLDLFFKKVDVILMPASACQPWSIDLPYPASIDGRTAGPRSAAIFSAFVNVAGIPAITIPVAPSSQGIPIGMQLVAGYGCDLTLFNLAREFEASAPWGHTWPAMS